MGTARFVYNKALDYIKAEKIGYVKANGDLTTRFITQETRAGVANSEMPEWAFDTPKDIRKGALRDLEKAFKTCYSQLKSCSIQKFQMGYRSRKKTSSLEIPSKALGMKDGKLKIYPKYLEEPIKISKREKKKEIVLDKTARLQYSRGQWFLVVPYTKKTKPREPPVKECCALDPGVRTFQTLYAPEEVYKFQQNRELHKKLKARLDLLQSLRDQKRITRASYTKSSQRIYRKVENLTTELHYKTIQYLKQYKCVLLPSFDSQEMVGGKRLHRKTKRELLGLQHYKFKTRLQHVMALDEYTHVEIVNEAYTSKTCTACGVLNQPSTDIYTCKACGLIIDRDINGARNILLKHLK